MANIKFYRKSTRPTNIAEGSLWFDSSKNRIILAGASSSADVVYGSYLNNCSASNGTLTITKIDGTSVSFTNTDTKVTSVDNHYTPTENTASQLNAMATNGTATWSQDVVTAVSLKRDAKGHVTGLSVSSGKIPANPNTDTKVTSVANHYTPSGGTETSGSFITGITKDAAGHVTKVTTRGALAASDIPNISADKITSGTISIDRLPKGALERLFVVDTESAAMSADVQEGDTVKVTGNSNKMYFCVKDPKATGATFATCFTEYTAGSATSVPWSGVTGKPDSYIPSSHTHTKSQITDFPTSMPASDVSAWAKAATKPTYTKAEVGLGNVGNFKAVSTVASQGLTDTEKTNARTNIGAGTVSSITADGLKKTPDNSGNITLPEFVLKEDFDSLLTGYSIYSDELHDACGDAPNYFTNWASGSCLGPVKFRDVDSGIWYGGVSCCTSNSQYVGMFFVPEEKRIKIVWVNKGTVELEDVTVETLTTDEIDTIFN